MLSNDPATVGTPKYDRIPGDKYYTPPWLVDVLVDKADLHTRVSRVWEPAAGNGAMVTALEHQGFNVQASDIAPDAHWIDQGDFHHFAHAPVGVDAIITNPPFGKHACGFVKHALNLMQPRKGLVAMLLRQEWDCTQGRTDLFLDCRAFDAKITVTKRPRWFEKQEGDSSPRFNFAWFVWDWSRKPTALPRITWGQ